MLLSHPARVRRAATLDDGYAVRRGEPVEIGRAWVHLGAPSSAEGIAAGQEQGTVAATLTFRAQGVGLMIGLADEVECAGRVWQVTGLLPVSEHRLRQVAVRARVEAP